MNQVLHAVWSGGMLHLWSEDAHAFAALSTGPGEVPSNPDGHPFAVAPTASSLSLPSSAVDGTSTLSLRLPARDGVPVASAALERRLVLAPSTHDASHAVDDFNEEIDESDFDSFGTAAPSAPPADTRGATALVEAPPVSPQLSMFRVRTLAVAPRSALETLSSLWESPQSDHPEWHADASVEYWAAAARLARWLIAQQRVVPMLVQTVSGEMLGAWRPWVSDEANAQRVARLVSSMPGAARAAADAMKHDPWRVTEDFLNACVDAACREPLVRESFADALDGRDPADDPHVALLSGLLRTDCAINVAGPLRADLVRKVRSWVSTLEERGASAAWRLLLTLEEPDMAGLPMDASPSGDEPVWRVSFHVQSADQSTLVIDAADIWLITTDTATVMGKRIDQPQDLLLKELARAARYFRRLDAALEESEPSELFLNTKQAYEFLREVRPVLLEQGFGVEAPIWWDTPAARLGAKLRISSPTMDPTGITTGSPSAITSGPARLSVAQLVNYSWEIAVGDTTLSLEEFEQLAARRTPLIRVNGKWVEVRPEDVQAAMKFIKEHPGGEVTLANALRLAYDVDARHAGVPVVGMEATGWVQAFFNSELTSKTMPILPPPTLFHGTLRPYQARGVSWMMFQERLGFGLCLADDMGLGKTVQLLALLAYEREGQSAGATVITAGDPKTAPLPHSPTAPLPIPPTLLLVPMSVVGNWMHETKRFCPSLKLLVHHGPLRKLGAEFVEAANQADLVVTTYTLAHRDRELFESVRWRRIVLDEAQYIKNPAAKQSQAARAFDAQTRIALTGTPVENRLTELWSILDFLNPGYLGGASSFRTRFGIAIERHRDKAKAEQLKNLIRPFVLRRLKSDPTVVADLPAKVESKEYSHLTSEQASLYEACVKRMLGEVDAAEGIQRRGLVLAALVRLKQICNHPSQILKDLGEGVITKAPDPLRSGKCTRILEMLEETLAEGDKSLVFTQFRQMGVLLEMMIRQRFGKDVLFIHGGVTQPQRQMMIERFQKADGTAPIMILSLKAGGVGLNLTAATHVFHFDRWWNPAVENQATDRAYRIGQTRTVQVHKFVVQGTLEERIDQMIESKMELAENIIGSGESWISELNTAQLRDVLALRNDTIADAD